MRVKPQAALARILEAKAMLLPMHQSVKAKACRSSIGVPELTRCLVEVWCPEINTSL